MVLAFGREDPQRTGFTQLSYTMAAWHHSDRGSIVVRRMRVYAVANGRGSGRVLAYRFQKFLIINVPWSGQREESIFKEKA